MARPKKEGMDYFPHDTDAVNDEKIEALRFLYGNDGYAFYFILLERIYRTKEFELDVSDAETIQILSRKVGVNEEKFLQMLETSLKRNCFDKTTYEERKVLTSDGIKKRASVVVEKRVKMREKYQEAKEEVSDAETIQETRVESTQSKVKESKEKESKVKKDYTSKIKDLLTTFSDIPNFTELNKQYWNVIRETRKTKNVQASVIYNNMNLWKNYDSAIVQYALKTHIEEHKGKKEEYTLGIMRGTTKEQAINRLNRKIVPMKPKSNTNIDWEAL